MLDATPRLLALLAASSLLFGCQASFEARASPYSAGHVLVMPSRDAIPEDASEKNLAAAQGTGEKLSNLLVTEFQNRGWEASAVEPSEELGHDAPISPEAALRSGRERGADYVLTTVMGDLRDAAPFTVVHDYVVIDAARMVDCASGQVVWELLEPYESVDSAFADPSGAVWGIAVLIGRSIEENAQ